MEWITSHWTQILEGILAFLGFFSVISKLTPWEWDNKILDFFQKIIDTFGLADKPE